MKKNLLTITFGFFAGLLFFLGSALLTGGLVGVDFLGKYFPKTFLLENTLGLFVAGIFYSISLSLVLVIFYELYVVLKNKHNFSFPEFLKIFFLICVGCIAASMFFMGLLVIFAPAPSPF